MTACVGAVRIRGLGSYLPARVVSNDEIAPRMNSTPEWIVSHTGIVSRHVAAADESASTLGARAARAALADAGVEPPEIGLLICATSTPDYCNYPSTACLIQTELGCVNAGAFDLTAACSGFMYGLELARGFLACHPASKVLVVGTEVLSRAVDWTDRTVAMLFGDGAGAAVLESVPADAPGETSVSLLGADGMGAGFIAHEGGYRRSPAEDPLLAPSESTVARPHLTMDGHAVFTFAVRKLAKVVCELCDRGGCTPGDLDLIVPHQANVRILEAVARRLAVPPERLFQNLSTVGNTSSASIPICLDEAVRTGRLRAGARIAMAGFGSGLTWAGLLSRWPYL